MPPTVMIVTAATQPPMIHDELKILFTTISTLLQVDFAVLDAESTTDSVPVRAGPKIEANRRMFAKNPSCALRSMAEVGLSARTREKRGTARTLAGSVRY